MSTALESEDKYATKYPQEFQIRSETSFILSARRNSLPATTRLSLTKMATKYATGNLGLDPFDSRDDPFFSAEEVETLSRAGPTASTAPAAQTPASQTSGTVGQPFVLPDLPPVYKQGDIGSCVTNATLAALRYAHKKATKIGYDKFEPSRMFLYRNARLRTDPGKYGTNEVPEDISMKLKKDSGSLNRTNIVALLMDGVCTEKLWPYGDPKLDENDSAFFGGLSKKPNPVEPVDLGAAQFEAKGSSHPNDGKAFSGQADVIPRNISFYRIYDPTGKPAKDDTVWQSMTHPAIPLLEEVLKRGWPFIFAIIIENSVNLCIETCIDEKTGVLPKPPADFSPSALGSHTMLAVGFDPANRRFLVQNSWGKEWNKVLGGRVWIPYEWFELDYVRGGKARPVTYDFWVIQTGGT